MNARIALTLLLALPVHQAEAGRYLSAIAVAVGSTAGGKVDPAPAPSGTCDNCNGTGRLGDGTVSVDCPLCVDGKVTSPAVTTSSPSPPATRHPAGKATVLKPKAFAVVKQPGPMWYQNGHSATVDHLVNVHGYDRATASRMTQAERDIAHSNAHNAGRYGTTRSSGCPGGRCPSPSRGGFRLFGRR
jgi:hypothetical protein